MALIADEDVTIPYQQLKQLFASAPNESELATIIANAPFNQPLWAALLFLGFICFYVVDEEAEQVRLAAVSDTEYYRMAVANYEFDPKKFTISLHNSNNDIVKAITEQTEVTTEDWSTLSRPQANNEAVRLNQASSGIACSFVRPLVGKRRGAIMYSYFQYQDTIGASQREFMRRYDQMASMAADSYL